MVEHVSYGDISVGSTGLDRFVREIDLSEYYQPYPMQDAFHGSSIKHKLLGGAAGPGKTLALIVEHMMSCNEFSDPIEAKQVHTLLLRRTHPKLEATLVTRFREKVPQELYASYNDAKKIVTWLNGSSTQFGSMQYEHNAYDWQGQWYKIGYDELGEFTFKQWNATSAWNRCPVSPFCTKDGASNPIGVGAGWIQSLFVLKQPCDEMDLNQRAQYNSADYEYFPCTYLDNPVYANDPVFLANLDSYPGPIRDALKFGKWGIAGGYFSGAWDPAVNVYPAGSVEIKPWWVRWMSGDWGFEHWAANHWLCIDDFGVIRIYREFVTNHEPPEQLGESIAKHSFDEDGNLPTFQGFYYSHDAFHHKTDPNTIALKIGRVLQKYRLPAPSNTGTDKKGQMLQLYQQLRKRIRIGEDDCGHPIEVPALQIADCCSKLIEKIPVAPRDEVKREEMADHTGDDPIRSAGHGVYGKLGRPSVKPKTELFKETLAGFDAQLARVRLLREGVYGQAT